MSFSVNTNIAALQAQNYLRVTSDFQMKTISRVTSGLRIVSSGDDAAGLAVANIFRSDQAVLAQGIRNANDGLSTLQTIDGGMNNISQLLDRARTLAAQSASGTFTGDRSVLNQEFQSVMSEINRQAQAIGMNTGGKFAKALSVFVGGGRDSSGSTSSGAALTNGSVQLDLSASSVDTKSLGLSTFTATSSGAATLATITAGTTGGNVDLTFTGAGFDSGVTVTAQGLNTAGSLAEVVSAINTAINTKAAAGGAFKDANVQAALSSDGGKIVFTGTSAFSISDGANGAAAAQNILGTAAAGEDAVAQGSKQVTLDYAAALAAGDSQDLTFSIVDSSGSLVSTKVNLSGVTTKAAAVSAINAALQGAGGDLAKLVAVNPVATATATGNVVIMGAGDFQVFVSTEANSGNGFQSGAAQGVSASAALVGSAGSMDISSADSAQQAVNALATAVNSLGSAQAIVGKAQNNLNYAISLGQSQITNLAAAESRIRDADLAQEAANLTKAQILLQAGTAALAQANSAPQAVLALLRG